MSSFDSVSEAHSSDSGERTLYTSSSLSSSPSSNALNGAWNRQPTLCLFNPPLSARTKRLHKEVSDDSDQWSISEDSNESTEIQKHHAPHTICIQTAVETWILELRIYTELECPNLLISKTITSKP